MWRLPALWHSGSCAESRRVLEDHRINAVTHLIQIVLHNERNKESNRTGRREAITDHGLFIITLLFNGYKVSLTEKYIKSSIYFWLCFQKKMIQFCKKTAHGVKE